MPKEVVVTKIDPLPQPQAEARVKSSKPKNLRVLHTQVDSWPKGSIMSPSHLPPGADVARLLSVKAVEEVDEPAGDIPIGPDSIAQAKAVDPEGSIVVANATREVTATA